MEKLTILILWSVIGFSIQREFDPSKYAYSSVLNENPQYVVYWIIMNQRISLALQINATIDRWIGFGFAELTSGSMPGSDMVVVYYDNSGNVVVEDRYAVDFVEPLKDTCQDWNLEHSYRQDGNNIFEISRNLNTKDNQDRPIQIDNTRIVWAIGYDSVVKYHQFRGASSLYFFGPPPEKPLPPDAVFADFRMPQVTVPSKKTTYMCQSFALPEVNDASIIMVEPLINSYAEKDFVHHMLIHVCEPGINGSQTKNYWDRYLKAGECASPVGDVGTGCISLLYAWAVGMSSLVLPDEAGFRMGTSSPYGIRHLILEIHYDNLKRRTNVQDSSGIRIWYTPTIRKYDAAVLTLGDVVTTLPSLPPQSIIHYETTCPEQCTLQWNHDITVFSDFLHLHQAGTQVWSTQHRDGEYIGDMNRIDFYSFDFQQNVPVNKLIKKGDRINTHCIYDTKSRLNMTKFGIASEDEMCMEFLSYYPILTTLDVPFTFCGYVRTRGENLTWCGAALRTNILPIPNPVVEDPKEFQLIKFGTPAVQCQNNESPISGGDIAIIVVIVCVVITAVIVAIVLLIKKYYKKDYTKLSE